MEAARSNYLRERREQAGLSQEKLGEAVDRSSASISRYELGHRGLSPNLAHKIAVVLGIQPYELFIEPTGK